MGKSYKYDVISSKKTEKSAFPQHFLGDTAKEAEDTLKEFETYLNNQASAYSASVPSIEKSDFFIEGVEALAKAKKDFDPKRGAKFTPYAKFLIVDAMNECVRVNRAVVQLPTYLNKANRIIYRVKILLGNLEDRWYQILFEEKSELPETVQKPLSHYRQMLQNAAFRARITCRQLADRAEFLPSIMLNDNTSDYSMDNDTKHNEIMAKLVVDKIMPMLTIDEQIVAELIMQDLNKVEIANIIGKSDMYVSAKLDIIKKKVLKMITGK